MIIVLYSSLLNLMGNFRIQVWAETETATETRRQTIVCLPVYPFDLLSFRLSSCVLCNYNYILFAQVDTRDDTRHDDWVQSVSSLFVSLIAL